MLSVICALLECVVSKARVHGRGSHRIATRFGACGLSQQMSARETKCEHSFVDRLAGPAIGKADLIARLRQKGYSCSTGESQREIYRDFKTRLGRHLQSPDRTEYSLAVLRAFIEEYEQPAHARAPISIIVPSRTGMAGTATLASNPRRNCAQPRNAIDTTRYSFLIPWIRLKMKEISPGPARERLLACTAHNPRVHRCGVQGYLRSEKIVERRVCFFGANF